MPAGALVHCAVRVPCQWAAGLVNLRAETPKRWCFDVTTQEACSRSYVMRAGSTARCVFADGKCSTGATLLPEPASSCLPAASASSRRATSLVGWYRLWILTEYERK